MSVSRRGFLRLGACAGAMGAFPTIIPARVLGAQAPSKKIQVGIIGCGRIANAMDIPGVWLNQDVATIVAMADPDLKRVRTTQEKTLQLFENDLPEIKLYQDYRELLMNPAVDAVMIASPDHWHAQQVVDAAYAKKDIYVQKPLALTISESRIIADVVQKNNVVFQLGTQQRSEGKSTFGPQFRKAVEFVRNGRIGRIKRVEIGLPQDPDEPADLPLLQPVPSTFNFDLWLGSAPQRDFCELRTHPQGKGDAADFGRPGWMVIQDYSLGMITNWGAHHIDIAQWALDMERSAPVKIYGKADFPKRRLWNAHGKLDVHMEYANKAVLHIADEHLYPNGIRFVGEEGWIFCGRGSVKATISDPGAGGKHGYWRPLEASSKKLIEGEVAQPVTRNTANHHRCFFASIPERKVTNTPVEVAHHTTTACILAYTAMNLKRTLQWDPAAERFVKDDAANQTLCRVERAPYGARAAFAKHQAL